MSNADERLAVIKQNYDDASDHEAADLANAKTQAQVAAIQANVAQARSAYYGAIKAMLAQTGADIESAYADAVMAQQAVADARKKAEAIAVLLGKLSDATSKATTLLNMAKALQPPSS